MSVLTHPEFDAHEHVAFHVDPASGLRAIIAVHNTYLGPALGGCRMWSYEDEEAAVADALRLSRAMTYKAALAGLPQGGGKSVILGDPRRDKTPAMMRAMGRFVDSLAGRYIVAEDSGTGVEDMKLMAEHTAYTSGVADAASSAAGRSGDPSPATAMGVLIGIRAAVRAVLGRDDLTGLRVAIQGLGSVGARLAGLLHDAGARLWVADVHAPAVDRCVSAFGATAVPVESIHAQPVDVFAPCALGGALNDHTVATLKARIVAGAANNQLQRPGHGEVLRQRGILYAPDYVVNAGGIIDIHYEGPCYDASVVRAHLDRIGATLAEIFAEAERDGRTTNAVADDMARARFGGSAE